MRGKRKNKGTVNNIKNIFNDFDFSPINSKKDRLISCVIQNGLQNEPILSKNFSSKTTIKQIKKEIKAKTGNEENKIVNLYYKGKELTLEDESIGNICNEDYINFRMISISLSDSIQKDYQNNLNDGYENIEGKSKIKEQIVTKLSRACQIHKNIEMYICINCGVSFCNQCTKDHNKHKYIEKNEIIKINQKLNEIVNKINEEFNQIGIKDNGTSNSICKEDRNELNSLCEQMDEDFKNFIKKLKSIPADFISDFNSLIPSAVEYQEKLQKLFEESKREDTISIDKKFVDFYINYNLIMSKEEIIMNQLNVLKNKFQLFKDTLNDLKQNSKLISDFLNENLLKLQPKAKMSLDGEFSELAGRTSKRSFTNQMNSDRKSYTKNLDLSYNSSTNNFGKMNLVNMFSTQKDKAEVAKAMKRNLTNFEKRGRYSSNQNEINEIPEKIEEQTESTNSTCLYNPAIKTSKLLEFNYETKKISTINLDLTNNIFKKFEAFHSTLNYKGKFYISGGMTTGKMVMQYKPNLQQFESLPNMNNKHSYHCLTCIQNKIFAISGYKSKKVEYFSLDKQIWTDLPDLSNYRSWPSCLCKDEQFLFVFGGFMEPQNNLSNASSNNKTLIEKLNFSNNTKSTWEIIEIESDINLPFYFGSVKLSNEKVLLLGGKYSLQEDNINECFEFDLQEKKFTLNKDMKLPEKDEFDGRIFVELEEGIFGQFSSLYDNKFYLVNTVKNEVSIFKEE